MCYNRGGHCRVAAVDEGIDGFFHVKRGDGILRSLDCDGHTILRCDKPRGPPTRPCDIVTIWVVTCAGGDVCKMKS